MLEENEIPSCLERCGSVGKKNTNRTDSVIESECIVVVMPCGERERGGGGLDRKWRGCVCCRQNDDDITKYTLCCNTEAMQLQL